MIKSMAMIKRKPGLSREEFIRYYEEYHAPLGMKHFKFARYVREHCTIATSSNCQAD